MRLKSKNQRRKQNMKRRMPYLSYVNKAIGFPKCKYIVQRNM